MTTEIPEFILLDDYTSTIDNPRSRLYFDPCLKLEAQTLDTIDKTLDEIQQVLNSGIYVVVVFSYELGEFLQNIKIKKPSIPYILAYGFKNVNILSSKEVDEFLNKFPETPSGFINLQPNIDKNQFVKDIHSIKTHIERGDCYQINYTFRIHGEYYGDSLSLYKRLKQRQPTIFGAYFNIDSYQFLSLSPEWFVSSSNGVTESRPMKGTLSINGHVPEDLSLDTKNRAENIMIVDLLRNDLGRISKIGSVKVPSLFEVSKVGELYQMTSTVQSKLNETVKILELIKALFPCGSITGAPKKMAMKIIHDLEKEPRGIYCGSIGWFDPVSNNSVENFSMNVAIRTLTLKDNNVTLGIGAGIVYDSDPESEWEECLMKGRFAMQLESGVGIFESMLAENNVILNFEKHLSRIKNSADALGLTANIEELKCAVESKLVETNFYKTRIKLSIAGDNKISVVTSELLSLTVENKIFWAHEILPSDQSKVYSKDPLLAHKTDNRKNYDIAFQRAEKLGGFDAIFVNELGHVTEGGRSNIFIKLNNKWLTPSLSCGLLPGIKRSELIENKNFNAIETMITVTDLERADEIYVTNSIRGIIKVFLERK